MTNSLESAEQMVLDLIESANRTHAEATWSYELTSDVDNIDVVSTRDNIHTLRVHPCWLRYVVAQDEFRSCVADEIEAWYLLESLVTPVPAVS